MNQELLSIRKRVAVLHITTQELITTVERIKNDFRDLIYDFRQYELRLMTKEIEKMRTEKTDAASAPKPPSVKKENGNKKSRGESKKPGAIKRPGSIDSARKNLKYLISTGMSQSQIAKEVGVAQSTISELKKYGASMTTIKALLLYTRSVRAKRRAEFELKKQASLNIGSAP